MTAAGIVGLPRRGLAARPRPRLIVLLIAEQFRSDYLDLFSSFLVSGGFRRLMDEGAYFPACQMAASTFTSGGLATVSTGAYPQVHGIVADAWYDRASRSPVVASPQSLEGTTVAEELAAADPANRIFAVSLDLRDAAFLAGRTPAEILYMGPGGRFIAQGRLRNAAWLAAFNEANSPEKIRNTRWFALGASDGTPPLRTLAYNAARPGEFLSLYRSSSFGQTAQMTLVRELVTQEKLGQGQGIDLLAIPLGSMALLGYEVGGESPLMREMVLQLDREVAPFLTLLDKHLGARNYGLIFTAAHGAPQDPDGQRGRFAIPGEAVARTIGDALSAHYDISGRKRPYVERYLYPFLYLRVEELRKAYIDPREARVLAGQAALSIPGVVGYYTADGDCSHTGEWLRRFRNSFHAVRSGDVMLAYGPEYVEDYGAGRGISYGSLYNYDSRVPLIFYGAPFEEQVFETSVESVDLAPTLARVAGTAWPSSTTGRVLGEALVSTAETRYDGMKRSLDG